jgi:hypothetical protein
MTGPRPSAPPNPRASAGHSPASNQRNAAAARAAAQPPASDQIPGFENMSFAQQRQAQDELAAGRAVR